MHMSTPGPSTLPLTTSRPELLEDGTDQRFRQLVHDLLAFASRLEEVRDRLGELIGLSGPRYTILISVAHLATRQEVSVTALARHLSYSQPFVTAEVNKLVAAGLVDKRASDVDGRSVSLTITPEGLTLLAELAPRQREINDQLFAELSKATFEQLTDLVPRLVSDTDRALDIASSHLGAGVAGTVTAS
jgi:DNA-binding MarR family transcriptional regulator